MPRREPPNPSPARSAAFTPHCVRDFLRPSRKSRENRITHPNHSTMMQNDAKCGIAALAATSETPTTFVAKQTHRHQRRSLLRDHCYLAEQPLAEPRE